MMNDYPVGRGREHHAKLATPGALRARSLEAKEPQLGFRMLVISCARMCRKRRRKLSKQCHARVRNELSEDRWIGRANIAGLMPSNASGAQHLRQVLHISV